MKQLNDKAELDSELRTEIIQKARLLYGGGWFARSVANTDTFPVQYLDAKGNPVDEVANDVVELFTSYHHQQLEQAVRSAELQARANALYEAADLVPDRSDIYKRLWNRRQEALQDMTELQSTKEDKSNE